jgi:hypothetical protein
VRRRCRGGRGERRGEAALRGPYEEVVVSCSRHREEIEGSLGGLSRVGAGNVARGGRAAVEAAVNVACRRSGGGQAGALERKGAVDLAVGGA